MATETALVAGIDIGAATAKVVILRETRILYSQVVPTGGNVREIAESLMKDSLGALGFAIKDINYIIATGYGRKNVPFACESLTEISCHARGVNLLLPQARTVVDIGGQDSKVIRIDGKGGIVNFVMNDKCAAGTGRFLEVMAKVLNADIETIGAIALTGDAPCRISNTCTVFAESEMITLRAEGESRENILAGIHAAMAHRVVIMGSPLGLTDQIVFTGGVARNAGMRRALENKTGKQIIVPEKPQIIGALGAAVIALDRVRERR